MPRTERQEQAYEFIKAYKAKHGYLPTVREIQEWLGNASPGSTQELLTRTPGLERVQIGKDTWRWDVVDNGD